MIYPYKCKKCNFDFKVMKALSEIDREEECPNCKSKDTKRMIVATPSIWKCWKPTGNNIPK